MGWNTINKRIASNSFCFIDLKDLQTLLKTVLALFAVLFLCTTTFSQSNKKLIKKGNQYFELQNYPKALSFYEKVSVNDVDDIEFIVRFGQSFLYSGDYDKAVKFLGKAVEMNESPEATHYLSYARALHRNNQFDKAIEQYVLWGNKSKEAVTARRYVQECRIAKMMINNGTEVKIRPIKGNVNTEFPDASPKINADGSRLFFASRRPNKASKKNHEDGLPFIQIYSASKRTKWKNVKPLQAPINTEGFNTLAGISGNGRYLFLYKSENGGDLYISKNNRGKWSIPEPLPDYINTSYHESSASLSPDGKTLYYIHGKEGNYDMYTSTRSRKGVWSKPKALEFLNTTLNEASPFIHADGKTLYFSSQGHQTMGGYDIFRSVKLSDGSWSKPENLGYPINTASDEVDFVLAANGTTGYYARHWNKGKGYNDIYELELAKSLANLTLYKGKVTDPKGNPLCADITLMNYSDSTIFDQFKSNCETGEFVATLPSGPNYGIIIEQNLYIFYSDNIQFGEATGYHERDTTIVLQEVKKDAKLILRNVHFEKDGIEITKAAKFELDRLVELMKANETIQIEITGHTDNTGKAGLNLLLSQKRVNNISRYLKIQNIGTSRIKARGKGDRMPIADNSTKEGRRQNTRIEIRIL